MSALQNEVLAALRRERENQQLTQLEAAMRMGISLSVFNKIERGAKGEAKLVTLERYAEALGCRLDIRVLSDENAAREGRPETPAAWAPENSSDSFR